MQWIHVDRDRDKPCALVNEPLNFMKCMVLLALLRKW